LSFDEMQAADSQEVPLEVIGAGFGRTGTNSLRLALERLGLGLCHHMHEVAQRPVQVPIWQAAAHGQQMDWRSVFAAYRSQVDWPGARFWRELAEAFPGAKVILTVRPVEQWFRSSEATVAREVLAPSNSNDPLAVARREIQREIISRQVFDGRPLDREHATATFQNHEEEVRATIAPDRLLVFDVSEGWAPLCAFLGMQVPEDSFPKTNSVAEFLAGTWVRDQG
jgi:Sulfotransferase domain